MNPDRLEALLWDRVDGTLAPAELGELETHIAENPEAKDLQREVEQLAERLDRLQRVAPPAGLRALIAGALPDEGVPRRVHELSSSAHPTPVFRRSVSWLPVAASLVVGVTIGYLLQPGAGGSVDDSRAAGSMIAASADQPGESMRIDLGQQAGSLAITRTGSDAAISIDLESNIDLEIDLEADDGGLLVSAVGTSASSDFDLAATAGRARFRTRGPSGHTLEMTTTSVTTPIRLVVMADGAVVAERWIAGDRNEISE